jgi:hypothetical protein
MEAAFEWCGGRLLDDFLGEAVRGERFTGAVVEETT